MEMSRAMGNVIDRAGGSIVSTSVDGKCINKYTRIGIQSGVDRCAYTLIKSGCVNEESE